MFTKPNGGKKSTLTMTHVVTRGKCGMRIFLFGAGKRLSPSYRTGGRLMRVVSRVAFRRMDARFTPPALASRRLIVSNLFNSKLGGPLDKKFTTMIGCVGSSPTAMTSVSVPSKLVKRRGAFGIQTGVVQTSIAFDLRLPGLTFLFTRGTRFVKR